MVLVPGQRGDDVETMTAGRELDDDAAHHLAGRGHVGREMGTEHEDVHEAAAPLAEPRAIRR